MWNGHCHRVGVRHRVSANLQLININIISRSVKRVNARIEAVNPTRFPFIFILPSYWTLCNVSSWKASLCNIRINRPNFYIQGKDGVWYCCVFPSVDMGPTDRWRAKVLPKVSATLRLQLAATASPTTEDRGVCFPRETAVAGCGRVVKVGLLSYQH
jgi:hypothetical protein